MGKPELINADDARTATKNAIEENIRKFNEAIQEEWEYWQPDIASAIAKAIANGEFNVFVVKENKCKSSTILSEMAKRHLDTLGYKTEIYYIANGLNRIRICWK